MSAPQLLIVDQSLRDENGHHYEYDISIADAAQRHGLVPTIVAHRACETALPTHGHAFLRYFERGWNEVHQDRLTRIASSVLSRVSPALRTPIITAGSAARRRLRALAPQAEPVSSAELPLPGFGRELADLVVERGIGPADHILIHTLGIPELHAVIAAFTGQPQWPLLHLVLRRDADERAVRDGPGGGVGAAFDRLAGDPYLHARVRVYCDTEHLCRQYEALSRGLSIGLLPIPHDLPPSAGGGPRALVRPARVTYLGNARTEKGFHDLVVAVTTLRDTHLATGLLRFVIQANSNLSLEEPIIHAARRKLAAFDPRHVELIDRSLSIAEFRERLGASDLVVLPYQAAAYRRRSSGILVQALVSGVPVIVPGHTWLADVSPPDAAETYSAPEDLAAAIARASDRLAEMTTAARRAAPLWRDMHNADKLVQRLIAGT